MASEQAILFVMRVECRSEEMMVGLKTQDGIRVKGDNSDFDEDHYLLERDYPMTTSRASSREAGIARRSSTSLAWVRD